MEKIINEAKRIRDLAVNNKKAAAVVVVIIVFIIISV